MVSEISIFRSVTALVVGLWLWVGPVYAQDLFQDFENLLERCRMSVETGSAFDIEGLQMQTVADRYVRDWGQSTTQEVWGSPQSELHVVLTQWAARDGTVRHVCEVRLAAEEYILEPVEQALFLRHFLIRQVELIGAGTHEIDKRLSPIPPLVNAAFLKLGRNPNGCIVSNNIAFSPDGKFFQAGVGEQAVKPCDAQ